MKKRILMLAIIILEIQTNTICQLIPRSAQITAGEYFIGTDPGEGNATPITIGSTSNSVTVGIYDLNTNKPVFVRFKNSNNLWSAARSIKPLGYGVNKDASIKYAEYFINTDPGKGSGLTSGFTNDAENNINLQNIELGINQKIYLRVQDSENRWSTAAGIKFPARYIRNAEFFTGAQPVSLLFGKGNKMTASDNLFNGPVEYISGKLSLWNRKDTIWVHVQTSDYLWSKLEGKIDTTKITDIKGSETEAQIPSDYLLYQNYPNPFNPSTNIKFQIPKAGHVKMVVYDILGREVSILINREFNSGTFNVEFNSSNLSSGIYYYTLAAGSFRQTKKLILLK